VKPAAVPDLSPHRVGSVAYLNSVPLTWGAEAQVRFDTPARLAGLLQADALDAALVSVLEVLRHDRYEVLDGISIASRGEVRSVLLAHRKPLSELREVHCDPASLTSIGLLRVLLAERGVRPLFRPLSDYRAVADHDAVLLIGDPALKFLAAPGEHRVWDLGVAWRELTGLPFVYAVWALRRGVTDAAWRARLRALCVAGLARREEVIARQPPAEQAACRDYLTRNIRYELGPEEKAGLRRFAELHTRHTGEPLHPVIFVR
jgi:chorismate dehydratase